MPCKNCSCDDCRTYHSGLQRQEAPPQALKLDKSYILRLLKRIPLLSRLSESDRLLLSDYVEIQTFPAETIVLRQGDSPEASGFFILVDGSARVLRKLDQFSEPHDVGLLSPGDYFGETALLTNDLRTASIVTSTACTALYISKDQFHALFGGDRLSVFFAQRRGAVSSEPSGAGRGSHGASEQVPTAAYTSSGPAPAPGSAPVPAASRPSRWHAALTSLDSAMKRPLRSPLSMTAQARMMLLDCLGQCPLLQGIDMDSRVTVVHAMYAVAVPAGSCILKQGEPGSKLYVIESGSCDVYVDRDEPAPARMLDAPHEERKDANDAPGSQAAPAPVATLGPKRIFGELALMHDAPRNATVLTREASVLWVLERVTFTSIVRAHGTAKLQTYLRLMRGVDFLAPLTEYERQKLAGAVEETFFPAGASVFQQGDAGDAMYVVLQGRLAVTRREGDAAVQLEQVAPGGYFGELALVFEQPRAATVTAVEASTCLKVDKTMFKLMLGPVVDYLATRAAAYTQPRSHAHAQQAAAQRPSAAPLELAAASSPAGVAMQDLEVVGTLGKGSFGFVQLVRDRAGALYALKSVSKQLVVQTAQQEHVLNEKYILAHLAHPFVIRLFQTYKSQHKLYFLTEAVMGGEVFTLLRRARCFPEHWTQFYAASVVLVLEYLHAYDVAYRDLKPENLLLDTAGFVRVCDFGFAKVVPDRTWTLCGTPDYLAPEIVASRGHGKSVDYWALGVLIFEMLASYPPFWDENQLQSFSKISEARYSFPSHFSPAARHLISALLDVNPNTRLGASADGAMRVRQHEFFAGVDWSRLYAKEVPVPHMPHVKSQVDTSNFTRGDATDDEVIPYVDDGSNWDRDF